MKKHEDDITFSELLGSSLAIAQHGIDLASGALFKRLKKTNVDTPKTKAKNKWIRSAGNFTRGFIGFIGKTGDAYMTTYEKLKKEMKE